MSNKPQLYKFGDIEHRLHTLEPGQSYIKPFVTSAVSDTMCGGLNFLNQVSVPWELSDGLLGCLKESVRDHGHHRWSAPRCCHPRLRCSLIQGRGKTGLGHHAQTVYVRILR